MKVLLADKLADVAVQLLGDAGHEVIVEPRASGDILVEALRTHQAEALIVRSTKVAASALDASSRLELIVRAGAGYDNIDVASASARGIFVANCPGRNAAAVAELTLGLMLALDRSIPENVMEARAGVWNKARFSDAAGLKGRTLGVIGLGNIGRAVVERAKGFDMQIIAWSRSLTDEKARHLGVERMKSPLDVAGATDIITLHLSATAETEKFADREFFERMKDGAFFINTTRASLVDEEALLWATEVKGIRAALDVMSNEPAYKDGEFSHRLASIPNIYLTHHIGASTQQAQDETASEAARIVNEYAQSGHVDNCVNLAVSTPATHMMTVRHVDKVGVLAAVLDEVRQAEWNVQEMENLIFDGAQAACARIRYTGSADNYVIDRIASNADVLAVSIIEV